MSTKRLCTVIPRQSRSLSFYHVEPSPPPHPYARPSPTLTSRNSGSGVGSNSTSGSPGQGQGSPNSATGSTTGSSSTSTSSTMSNSAPQAQGQSQGQGQGQAQSQGGSSSSSTHASAPLSPGNTTPSGQPSLSQPASSSSQVQALSHNQQNTMFPRLYTDFLVSPPYCISGMAMKVLNASSAKRTRAKMAYRFSAGAYGIPKRRASTLSGNMNANGTSAVPFGSPPTPLSHPASYYGRSLNASSPITPNITSNHHEADLLNLAIQVGEDAYFIRPDAMGVADGVGGWSRSPYAKEANSAMFSRSLMHYCSYEIGLVSGGEANVPSSASGKGKEKTTSVEGRTLPGSFFWDGNDSPVSASSTPPSRSSSATASSPPDINPLDILQRSYDRCMASFKGQGLTGGSATALLAILRDQELRVAHLGDCALIVMRNGDLMYRSEEMQHAFNYPLQLGPSSPTQPSQARLITVPVQEDDIVILSSDGMTDNLWDEDVIDEVRKFMRDAEARDSSGSSALSSSMNSSSEGSINGTDVNKHLEKQRWRALLPAQLSKALCSRAKKVSESGRKDGRVYGDIRTSKSSTKACAQMKNASMDATDKPASMSESVEVKLERLDLGATSASNSASGSFSDNYPGPSSSSSSNTPSTPSPHIPRPSSRLSSPSLEDEEIPFARRAREEGIRYPGGGKCDDISVLVAVISACPPELDESESDLTSPFAPFSGFASIPAALKAQLLMNVSMSSTSSSSLPPVNFSLASLHPSSVTTSAAFP